LVNEHTCKELKKYNEEHCGIYKNTGKKYTLVGYIEISQVDEEEDWILNYLTYSGYVGFPINGCPFCIRQLGKE
jgi:hypothetical protein